MTTMMHRFPEHNAYERRMQDTRMAMLESSANARAFMPENYTGLPF